MFDPSDPPVCAEHKEWTEDCEGCEVVWLWHVAQQPDAAPYVQSVTVEFIDTQRRTGWPDIHPESFCHRCGQRNPVWHAAPALWNEGTASRPRGRGDILCPTCFATEYERAYPDAFASWELRIAILGDDHGCG